MFFYQYKQEYVNNHSKPVWAVRNKSKRSVFFLFTPVIMYIYKRVDVGSIPLKGVL